jgi:Membrane-bound serine protease (ClpP class)
MTEFMALLAGHIPALIVVLFGYALLILEMFLPGFGVAGGTGAILTAVGIALMHPTGAQAAVLVAISVVILGIALSLVVHGFKSGRLRHKDMVLTETVNAEEPKTEAPVAVGDKGTVQTDLHPTGIAMFGLNRVNVVSEGGYIVSGTKVRVEKIEGMRIIVVEDK